MIETKASRANMVCCQSAGVKNGQIVCMTSFQDGCTSLARWGYFPDPALSLWILVTRGVVSVAAMDTDSVVKEVWGGESLECASLFRFFKKSKVGKQCV